MEVLGDAKATMDNDGGSDGRDGRDDESGNAPKSRISGGEERSDVWAPSTAGAGAGVARARRSPPSAQARTKPSSAWAEEDKAVARRLKHLDTVAARLEEAGAEIEANIDLLGLEHSRLRRAVDHHHHPDGYDLHGSSERPGDPDLDGWTRTDEDFGGGAGGGRGRRRRRDKEAGGSAPNRPLGAARGRVKVRAGGGGGGGSVVSRRLVAPTVSSKNKTTSRPGPGGAAAATRARSRGTTPAPAGSRSPTRPRFWAQRVAGGRGRKAKGRGDDGLGEAYEGRERRGRPVVVRVVGGGAGRSGDHAGSVSEDDRSVTGSGLQHDRRRRGGERSGDDVLGAEEEREPAQWRRTGGRRGSGRPLYSDDDGEEEGFGDGDDRGYYDSAGSGSEGESGASTRGHERQEMEEQDDEDERAR